MNNSMLAFLGVPEIIVIFLVLLVMAGMAAAVALLVVWLLRRNEGTPAARPTSPPRFDPPHVTGKAGRLPFADLRAGGVRIRWGNYLAGMAVVVLGGALLNGSLLAVGVWSGMDTVLFGLLVAVVAFHLFVIRDFHRAGHAAVSGPAPPGVPPTQPPAPAAMATPVCPRCGASLPVNSPQGLCPRCVMGVGLATHTEVSGETGPHGTKVAKPIPSPEDIARHFPQLEILECLGRGGMGVVYKARQPKLNRLVALKILAPEKGADPKFAERFLREAQALARLSHPNIVTVHDFGEADGMFFLLMEYVEGMTLRQLLREARMKPEEALAIVPKICEALQFAHEQGVVHRDIKPENVLLDKQGRVKIADFGIAKIVGGTGEPLTPSLSPSDGERVSVRTGEGALTQDQILGTPNYMAPEQVEKPQLVDHRADIYSLGVVFYEMLTGELPLGKFQPPSKKVQVDVRLDEVVLHALEKEPARRYQHASEVKTDVETIVAGGAKSEVRSPKPEVAASSPARFSRSAIWGAIWAPFGLLGLLLYFLLSVPNSAGSSPQLKLLLLALPLALLGLTAPFGTTVLGWIAILQIRHSRGRLYGLGLAVFNALLFPLLVLNGLLIGGWNFVADELAGDWIPYLGRAGFTVLMLGVIAASCGLASWFIFRAVWRAVKIPLDGRDAETSRAPGRASRVVGIGALVVVIAILGVVVAPTFFSGRNETPASLAKSPQKLKSLPTATVIQAGLAEASLPWAWNELKRRSEAGQLKAGEADMIVAELAAWMRREHPQGYDEPLHWLGGLLDELGRRRLVTDEKVLAFLEAFHGQPRCEPLFRVRETEPRLVLAGTCRWRSPWHPELFGLKLLNEMRSITIDGKEVKWRDIHPDCDRYEFYGDLELPSLAPGNYSVRFEIQSALIAKGDVVGLAPDTRSEDWPPGKRRWTRVCQSELIVYPEKTEIVNLTEDAALDPVAGGALSVNQVIIRSDANRATAAVAVVVLEKDNSGQKLLVPICFDVSLRLSGETYRCGHFWNAAKGTKGGFTPNSGSRSELRADIKPLSAEVREAEVVLTPNPKAVEKEGSIDRIWGREIVFPHVRLVREDLRGADKPAFGAAIEAVLPFGAPCENHYLQFRSGRVFTIGRGPATTQAEYDEDWKRAKAAGGVDVSAGGSKEGIQFVGEGCIFTGERKPTWETTTAEEVLQQLEHASWLYGVTEPRTKDFPVTYLFKTARGECGLVQLLDIVEDSRGFAGSDKIGRGLKLRWKLVQSDADSVAGSQGAAQTPRRFVRLVVEADAMTFEGHPTRWDDLGALLAKVPERANTVLEFAVTSDQITVAQQNEWFQKIIVLARQHGLVYASFIGIHPLGSKGTARLTPPP